MTDWKAPSAVPPLASLDVHVWIADVTQVASLQPHLETVLSDAERKIASAFYFGEDTTRFVVAHGALRLLLSSYVGMAPDQIEFSTGTLGKPVLAGTHENTYFNISHSGERLLFGFGAGGDVGVDVERIRTDAEFVDMHRVASLVFSAREQSAFSRLAPEHRSQCFYAIWSRKESYIKATGVGISKGLDWFTVSHHQGDAHLLADRTNPHALMEWQMQELPCGDDYAGAVTYASPMRSPKLFTLEAELLRKLCGELS